MTLDEYLSENGLSQTEFARLHKKPQQTVNNLCARLGVPTRRTAQWVYEATSGAVTWADLCPPLDRAG